MQVMKTSEDLTIKEQIQLQEYIREVTQKGQVTIPKPIRELLGVGSYEPVAFRVEKGRVELRQPITLEAAYGAVPPFRRPADLKEQVKIAQEEHACQVVKKLKS